MDCKKERGSGIEGIFGLEIGSAVNNGPGNCKIKIKISTRTEESRKLIKAKGVLGNEKLWKAKKFSLGLHFKLNLV